MVICRFILLTVALGLLPAFGTERPAPPQTFMKSFPGTSALSTFTDCVNYLEGWLGPDLPDWVVHSSVFTYWARKPLFDASGQAVLALDGRQATTQVRQSGRIFYPPTWRLPFQRALTLVVYPHFTALRKQSAPSEFGGHEWLLGAAAAVYYGFAVAMPDLPGMGVDAEHYHPFCHARSLAYATLDGIPAMQAQFRQDPWLVAGGYAWDGRLFVMGYSEGAYTALATVKELETHRDAYAAQGNFTLTGSACMAGPFDLSGLSRAEVIRPGGRFSFSFFLPYLLMGYHSLYGPRLDPREAFAPVLLERREDGNILDWLDGSLDGFTVSDLIQKRLGLAAPPLTRDLLNPDWVARNLDDPGYGTSPVRQVLQENDLDRGWTPTRPILFCHSPADTDVAYQQTVSTMDYLGAEILKAGGDPQKLLILKPIGDSLNGLGHLGAIALAMPVAFDWIYHFADPDPGLLAPGTR